MGSIGYRLDGAVAVITLDNVERHNAIDAPMRDELARIYREIDDSDAIRVGVITGAGDRAFCSGGYIDAYLEGEAFGSGGVGPSPIPRPWPARKPFIAAIRGYALGGGFALALACDLRVVGPSARIGPSGLKRGAVQGAQTIQRLTRLIGGSRALRILLLSQYLTGQQAADVGLASLAGEDRVLETALEEAHVIAAFSPWTVQMTKLLVHQGQHLPIDEAIAWEDEVAAQAYRRDDALEGFRAFAERRPPRF